MKMQRKHMVGAFGVLVVVGALTGYWLGAVLAEGIPATGALQYAGTLTEGGTAVDGFRDMTVRLWSHESSTDLATYLQCETIRTGTPVDQGRFTVVLDDDCTDATKRFRDLWVEISVGGATFPREKLGAVPFAAEAANGVPIGTVIDWWRPTETTPLPDGWEFCDGTAVVDPRSPILGVVKPDLRDRFARGLAVAVEADIPAEGFATGGADHFDVPAHNHQWSTFADTSTTNTWSSYGATGSSTNIIVWDDGMDSAGAGNNPLAVDDVTGPDDSKSFFTDNEAEVLVPTVPAYVGLVKLCRVR